MIIEQCTRNKLPHCPPMRCGVVERNLEMTQPTKKVFRFLTKHQGIAFGLLQKNKNDKMTALVIKKANLVCGIKLEKSFYYQNSPTLPQQQLLLIRP